MGLSADHGGGGATDELAFILRHLLRRRFPCRLFSLFDFYATSSDLLNKNHKLDCLETVNPLQTVLLILPDKLPSDFPSAPAQNHAASFPVKAKPRPSWAALKSMKMWQIYELMQFI